MKTANIGFVIGIAALAAACNRVPEQQPAPTTESTETLREELQANIAGGLPPGVDPPGLEARRIDSRPASASCALDTDGSGCQNDDDCAPGTVCSCYQEGAIGSCVASDCRLDSDCRNGLCEVAGAITGTDCKSRAQEYRCTTAADECEHSLDCAALAVDATCVYDRARRHRICTRFVCRM